MKEKETNEKMLVFNTTKKDSAVHLVINTIFLLVARLVTYLHLAISYTWFNRRCDGSYYRARNILQCRVHALWVLGAGVMIVCGEG